MEQQPHHQEDVYSHLLHVCDATPADPLLRLAALLHEIAEGAGAELELEEARVPVTGPVHAACELLGLDPLSLASEGRFVAFVPPHRAASALRVLRSHPKGHEAERIGSVREGRARVVVRTALGTRRLLPLPAGDPLPRIC